MTAPPDESPTLWDHAQQQAEAVAERVVALGILDRPRVDQALTRYRDEAPPVGFSSFLVQSGLVGLDKLDALHDALAAPATSPLDVQPGTRLSGCVIERKLGQGGMGVVFLAHREPDGGAPERALAGLAGGTQSGSADVSSSREAGERSRRTHHTDLARVVVKFLGADHVRSKAARVRFVREALVTRDIDHPNVVKVFSVDLEGPAPHLVMELVEGEDLEERLRREGRLPWREVARLGRDVALGLAAAHAHGVIHRDVKPGNVRVTPAGQVKLLDFGLAKSVQSDAGVTLAGQVLGTPYYMAPEQWGDHEVDERCDVHALGATLYHLVTGEVPFAGARPSAICRKALEGQFTPPRVLAPDVPEDLELAILRMMARDRRARFASAQACADALARVLDGQPVDVPRLVDAAGRRHALVPGTTFHVGSHPDCEVRVEHESVAPDHARVELRQAGFTLLDLGAPTGTRVEGMRVHEVLLRDGDRVRAGEVELTFHDAGVTGAAATRAAPPGRTVRAVPDPFLEALAAAGDRRVVLWQVEQLPEAAIDARVAASRSALRRLFGGDVAERAGALLESRLRRRRREAIERLFTTTHENLGGDVEAWLRWWDRAAPSYPPQLGAFRLASALHLRVVHGEDAGRTFDLGAEQRAAVLGRGEGCDVLLRDRSVSRRHATLVRLDQRVLLRDEGSRFGVRVNGDRVASALLRNGDRLTLGLVELVLETDDWDAQPPRAGDGALVVDAALFDALVELRHPGTRRALERFAALAAPDALAWVDRGARALEPDAARAGALAASVRARFDSRAREAREALAAMQAGDGDGQAQVAPLGWLPGVKAVERA